MTRTYHTVCVLEDGQWFDEFGSYSLAEAKAEAAEMRWSRKRGTVKVISHVDTAAAMMAARDALPK